MPLCIVAKVFETLFSVSPVVASGFDHTRAHEAGEAENEESVLWPRNQQLKSWWLDLDNYKLHLKSSLCIYLFFDFFIHFVQFHKGVKRCKNK